MKNDDKKVGAVRGWLSRLVSFFKTEPETIERTIHCIDIGGWYAKLRANRLLENKPIGTNLRLSLLDGIYCYTKISEGKVIANGEI